MFVRIKDFIIYIPVNVTIVVTEEEDAVVDEQEACWEDEREQMLDDYD